MEPSIFRDIDSTGETLPIVDLPVEAGIEYWRILHGVRETGLVLAQIDPFGIGAVIRDTKLNAKKPAACGC